MKFNSNNNALSLLFENTEPVFSSAEDNADVRSAVKFINTEFTAMRSLFRQKIQYVCEPFYDALQKSRAKLVDVLAEEEIDQAGTFIMPLSGGGTSTIFYKVKTSVIQGEWKIDCVILQFNKTKQMPEPYLIGYVNNSPEGNGVYINSHGAREGNSSGLIITEVLSLILFTKYCDLETKVVPAGKKQVHSGEKYLNETANPIEILDSTWFTSIVRSQGFTVGGETGGFFRLQPCGPGRSEKKLIWISAFEKSGYTRKAKVLLPKDK